MVGAADHSIQQGLCCCMLCFDFTKSHQNICVFKHFGTSLALVARWVSFSRFSEFFSQIHLEDLNVEIGKKILLCLKLYQGSLREGEG